MNKNDIEEDYFLYLKSEGLPRMAIDDLLMNQEIKLNLEQKEYVLLFEQKMIDNW